MGEEGRERGEGEGRGRGERGRGEGRIRSGKNTANEHNGTWTRDPAESI